MSLIEIILKSEEKPVSEKTFRVIHVLLQNFRVCYHACVQATLHKQTQCKRYTSGGITTAVRYAALICLTV